MSTLTTSINDERESSLYEFTHGIDLDCHLVKEEMAVQKAWVRGLERAGYLNENEKQSLLQTLEEASTLMEKGSFDWRKDDEDIHMNLERFLTEKLKSLGKKIHLGRSRNDLIATSLRLHVKNTSISVSKKVSNLILALVGRAKEEIDVIVPGLTHLQFGQPIRLSQIYLSHAYAFKRDLTRLNNSLELAMENMPLGSAALTGTTISIDLNEISEELGFSSPPMNSYDSVGDRDYMISLLDSFSSVALHLSRLAEDIILWSSSPFGLVKLPPEWSTGSSIMPNKRNPDVAELTRGLSAQILGHSQAAHTLLKGLPSSYSSDLHELKRIYLNCIEPINKSLSIFPRFISGLRADPKKAKALLLNGHILSTEVANKMTDHGMDFREAYQLVASMVELANSLEIEIHQLPPEELTKIAPQLPSNFMTQFSFEAAVEMRTNLGGTSKESIQMQIKDFQTSRANG